MAFVRRPKEVSDERFNELIRAQYDELDSTLELDLDKELRKLLIPQTIHGRAMEGHGSHFDGCARPSISLDYVFRALNLDPTEVRQQRQKMMEDFLYCIDDLIDGKTTKLVDRTGRAIYGINFLQDFELEVDREFFKGGALVGRMDSPVWRERTKIAHPKNLRNAPLKLGYGEELPIDPEKLREHDVALVSLEKDNHTLEDLMVLRAKGVIVPEAETSTRTFENHFVRYSQGMGVCDDAALISVGLLHGRSAMVLGFAIDATDTYTKFCENKVAGGFDEHIGAHIERRWEEKYGEKLISDKETTDIIYLGAKNTYEVSSFSSSHRRLIQYEIMTGKDSSGNKINKKQPRPTILNHLKFVTDGKAEEYELGFDRFHSLAFYENIRERFRRTGRQHFLPRYNQKGKE